MKQDGRWLASFDLQYFRNLFSETEHVPKNLTTDITIFLYIDFYFL